MKENFNYEKINMYLEDIRGYVSSYLFHLDNPNEYVDIEEINAYISTIPEIIDELKELVMEIYEKESN